ncbi:hypothetical protein FRB99_002867 [Tulasnella sp. 403]|nr:hypothetical protein FRB99_002867 [Tulasnella sp. 403]
MKSQLRAVFFDIGGVVITSPLLGVAKYEKEHGLPPAWINLLIVSYGDNGAWQRFERGELGLFAFYDVFSEELSDVVRGNGIYVEYCRKKGIECPVLPGSEVRINGRELFAQMMRNATPDPIITHAIQTLRLTRKYKLIALTNNFSGVVTGPNASPSIAAELKYIGWENGPASEDIVGLFDDFVDSSVVGMRKPEKRFFIHACEKHGLDPTEVIFLDDLVVNLRAAEELGMETIRVPIGNSRQAVEKLGQRLGVDLTLPQPISKL